MKDFINTNQTKMTNEMLRFVIGDIKGVEWKFSNNSFYIFAPMKKVKDEDELDHDFILDKIIVEYPVIEIAAFLRYLATRGTITFNEGMNTVNGYNHVEEDSDEIHVYPQINLVSNYSS